MLLVDAGNSALKTRWISGGIIDDRVFPLVQGMASSGIAEYLDGLENPTIYLSSVARAGLHGELMEVLHRSLPAAQLVELQTLPSLGDLNNGYRDHRQLGVDRWLTIVAAAHMTEHDAVIIDAGTAIKLELLSSDRGYLGGAILPGFKTSKERFRALFNQEDLDFAERNHQTLPGRITAECIRLSPFPVSEGFIAELIGEALGLLDNAPGLLLTGQDAERVASIVDSNYSIVPDMVFRGMLQQIQSLG